MQVEKGGACAQGGCIVAGVAGNAKLSSTNGIWLLLGLGFIPAQKIEG
jgi:hypothetical protein